MPYDYSLNNGPFTTNPLFQFLQGGVVQTLVVRDANGCEREISIQLSEGSTPKDIGEELDIPANTVSVYKKRVTAKLCEEIRRLNIELG